jgi:hypothetical protein
MKKKKKKKKENSIMTATLTSAPSSSTSSLWSQVKEFVAHAYVPGVLVHSTTEAESLLASACAGERALATLLRPHASVIGGGGSGDELRTLRFNSLQTLLRASHPTSLDRATAAAPAPRASVLASDADGMKSIVGIESAATPWFRAYSRDLLALTAASQHDYLTQPTVVRGEKKYILIFFNLNFFLNFFLKAILACATEEKDCLSALGALYSAASPPAALTQLNADTHLALFYVLLHRVPASATPEQRAVARAKADSLLSECQRTFGTKAVILLDIAVDDVTVATSGSAVDDDDRAVRRSSTKRDRSTLRHGASSSSIPAAVAAATATAGAGAAAAGAAGLPVARRPKANSGASTPVSSAPRTLADVLNGEGLVALRSFLSEVYEKGVLVQYRKQLAPLAEHVAQKRSKISTLRGWLSGNKNKPKKDGIEASNILNRSLEEQTRRLADIHFVLREHDNAQQQYKAAAGDFKNEKLHEAYASAQEMIAATMLAEAPRSVAAIDRRQVVTVVSHLNNAFNSYERAGAVHLAQRVSVLLQLVLRVVGEHLQAADACLRATEFEGTDDLYAAMMYEQSAMCYLYCKPKALFRRCTFRLVNAGACFDGAHQRMHALRCYATAFAAYKAFGWPIINEQLHSLLVRHYAMQGQLDNALHFALALLQSHATTPPAVQASHLREYLYLHQAVHASSSESRAHAIAQYADAADHADDASQAELGADEDDYADYDPEPASLSASVGDESSTPSSVDSSRGSVALDAPLISLPDPPTLPLPIVHNDVEFVFQDSSTASSTTASAPLNSLSPGASEADVLGMVPDDNAMWPTLETRLFRNAQRLASSGGGATSAAGTAPTQLVDERLPRGSALFKLWMRDANEALGVVRPISVVQEPITVTVSVTNPLGVPLQLSRVRLLASLEPLDGSGKTREALRTEPIEVLLEPREKQQLALTLTPLAIGMLHVRGAAFTVAGQVDGACMFGNLAAAAAASAASSSSSSSSAATPGAPPAAPSGASDRAAAARAAIAQQVLIAPPMPLMEAVLSDVPMHLCAGELARVRLRLRNVGQKPMCNVWVTSNMAQCVWFGDERGSSKRFCAPVRVPGSRLMPGASHELHVWLRAPPGDVATGELSRLVMRLALAFYYEPANDPGQVPTSASASGASLAYRFQRVQARIDVAPSLRLAYLCSARPHEVGSRLVRVSVHNKWRSGVFRISRITARSPRWSVQLALDGDIVTDVNDAIVRPEESAHVLLKALPLGSAEDKSFVTIDLGASTGVAINVAASVDASGAVVDPRAASDSDVWLQPVNDAALAAVRATASACDYFHEADLRGAALRSALASGTTLTAATVDSVPRRANWCDIVLHWELANVRGDVQRFGQLSLCDVRLDRGPLFAGSDSSLEALRERRLSMSLLSEPTLPIEHVRLTIEAPALVTHDFAQGPCVRTVTAVVYNCHPTQSVAFVLQLLKPHEQMLADAATSRMRRRTRVATSLVAASAQTPFRLAETGLRRAAQNCAARAAGPGSGGGGGVRAKGSCLFIGVQQRGPFTLAPREQRSVAMLVLFPETGVHNVSRMRVVVDSYVLPADSQTLVVVEQQQPDEQKK